MKSLLLFLASVIVLSCIQVTNGQTGPRVVDLSHSFDSETVYWPTAESFQLDKDFEGVTDQGFYYSAYKYRAAEHGGTHIDAPVHFARGGYSVDQIPLTQLMGAGIVIDVTRQCATNPDYRVLTQDLLSWEKQNGRIPANAIVFLRTGFGKRYPNRQQYLGTDQRGPDAVAQLHFPGLHPEAATWLTNNRSVNAIGIDTASIDYGQSKLFETHQIISQKNIPAFENVANLDQLPVRGFRVTALPMKIKGGSGGPLRIIAVLNQR